MKYIYILGQDHSGSTLVSQILSTDPKSLALGEVYNFFSSPHLKKYIEKWGMYDVAYQCSCGKKWQDCSFWSSLQHLSGINSALSLHLKYKEYFNYLNENYCDFTIIDSSKSLDVLQFIIENKSSFNFNLNDLLVVYQIKDVRSFCLSMMRKSKCTSLKFCFHTFNYWIGQNSKIFKFLKESQVDSIFSLYEKLCLDYPNSLKQIAEIANLNISSNELRSLNSHIVLSNKDFLLKKSKNVRYDFQWFHNSPINIMYFCHYKARIFNERLYKIENCS